MKEYRDTTKGEAGRVQQLIDLHLYIHIIKIRREELVLDTTWQVTATPPEAQCFVRSCRISDLLENKRANFASMETALPAMSVAECC
jgi:hypothetical protein